MEASISSIWNIQVRFKPTRYAVIVLAVMVCMSALGCGSSGEFTLPNSIDTLVDRDTMKAGELLDVVCVDARGISVQHPDVVVYAAGPEEQLIVDGVFAPTLRGGYTLACGILDTEIVDPEPVYVYVEPGPIHDADSRIDPEEAKAGDPVIVDCIYTDAYGNEINRPDSYIVEPEEGWSSVGSKVVFKTAGVYSVTCTDSAAGISDPTPAYASIWPGLPRTIRAVLNPPTVAASEPSIIQCVTEDEYGNAIPPDQFPLVVSHPENLALNGLEISGTVAGLYQIKCLPQSEDAAYFEIVRGELTVLPGPPHEMVVVPIPEKDVYKTYEIVDFEISVLDEWGNLIPDPPLTKPTASPTPGIKVINETTVLLKKEGVFLLTFTLDGLSFPFVEMEIVIDGSGPSVVIEQPLRGETRDDKPVINVIGTINDPFAGIASFLVNDYAVAVDADGNFTRIVPLHIGMNTVTWTAVDLGGNESDGARGLYYSPEWYPYHAGIVPETYVPRGLIMSFREDFIDDGVHDHNNPNDLATILELVVGSLDLNGLLPNPVASSGSYQILVHNVVAGPLSLWLTPLDGAMAVEGTIAWLSANIEIEGECKVLGIDLCPDFSGSINISELGLSTEVELAVIDGVVVSNEVYSSVTVGSVDVNIDGILGWMFDWILDIVVDLMTPTIEDAFQDAIGDELGAMMGDLFGELTLDEQLEVNSLMEGFPGVLLDLKTNVQNLVLSPQGMIIEFKALFWTPKQIDRNPLGSMGRARCMDPNEGVYVHSINSRIGIAMFDDFLNEALFGVWWGGLLNLTIGAGDVGGIDSFAEFGISEVAVNTNFFLPPILNDCYADRQQRLEIADGYIEADMLVVGQPVTMGAFIQLVAGVEIGLVDNDGVSELGINIQEVEYFDLEVVSLTGSLEGSEEAIEEMIKENLMDEIVGALLGDTLTSFPLPEVELSKLDPSFPPGLKIAILPTLISRDSGYTVIQGDLN